MTKNINYWHGIHVDDVADAEIWQKIFDKLLDGNYQGADLDLKKQGKKGNYPIFGVRINDSDRLLFTTIEVDGKPYLKLLDVVLNHDYQKSRFFKSGVLREYLEKNREEIAQQIREGKNLITRTLEPAEEAETEEPLACFQVHFYDHKFITLNTEQQQVLQAKLPVVVSGGPGSGKSCVAISLLEQLQESLVDTENPRPLLYVTQSEHLIKSMKRMWDDLPQGEGLPEVQFKTYTQLLHEVAPETADKTIVGEADFKSWLKNYIDSQKSISKTAASYPSSEFFKQTDLIYQEFRLMSGFSPDEYSGFGVKQCHFHDANEKKWLLDAFKAYQNHLDISGLLNPAFFPLNKKEIYSTIVVDEAQDLSNGQLQDLLQLSTDSQTSYLMDTHQSLVDGTSQRAALIPKVRAMNHELSHITLPFSYRCPPNITAIANAVIGIKTQLTGGRADKYEESGIQASHEHNDQGRVYWFEKMSDEEKVRFSSNASTQVAIVTSVDFREEALKLFNTPLVFTPEEIKGLEYPTIIAWRPFDTSIYKEANTQLAKGEGSSSTEHRSKKGRGDNKFGPPFNKIFTTLTRAMSQLIIFQETSHDNKHIVSPLQEIVRQQATSSVLAMPAASTEKDWKEELERQDEAENEPQANAIREHIGSKSAQNKTEDKSKKALKGKGKGKAKRKQQRKVSKEGSSSSAQNKAIALQAEVTKKDRDFLEHLFDNFNKTTLKKLFSDKDRIRTLLFDVPVKVYSSFILAIYNSKCLPDLFEVAKKCRYKFSGSDLSVIREGKLPVLFYLTQDRVSREFLNRIIEQNPKLIDEISAEALCAANEHNVSALYYLSASFNGRSILYDLLKNKKLAAGITTEALCRQEDGYGFSPFHYLCQTEQGQIILDLILESNPSILNELTYDDLDLPAYQKTKDGHKVFVAVPGSYLPKEPVGRKILARLPCVKAQIEKGFISEGQFKSKQPFGILTTVESNSVSFASQAPEELALDTPEPSEIEKTYVKTLFADISQVSLDNLFSSPDPARVLFNTPMQDYSSLMAALYYTSKLSILDGYLKNNNQIELNPPTSVLFKPTREGVPGFFYLCVFDKGIEILNRVLKDNPQRVNKAFAEALCVPLLNMEAPYLNTSALYHLCSFEAGIQFLKNRLETNSEIAESITAEALCRRSKNNFSPLVYLCQSSSGLEALETLLTKNPQIAKGIKNEDLLKPIQMVIDGRVSPKSPLNYLMETEKGKAILRLIKSPSAKKDSPTLSAQVVSKKTDMVKGKTPLALVSHDTSTNKKYVTTLLENLDEAKLQDLFAKSDPEQWIFEVSLEKYPSLIAGLVCEGQIQTLFDYLKSHEITLYPTPKDLCLIKEGFLPNIYYLCTSDSGKKFLNKVLDDQEDDDFIKEITGRSLCAAVTSEDQGLINASALSWLSKEESGRLLLKRLLAGNPALAHDITAKALCRLLNPYSNDSPFYMLCSTATGLSILKTLFTINPSIAKAIKDYDLNFPLYEDTPDGGRIALLSPRDYLMGTEDGREILTLIPCANLKQAKSTYPDSFFSIKSEDENGKGPDETLDINEGPKTG